MINSEDEVIYDLKLSCTEEEAIAKLLGWMQGSKRLRYITVTEDGIDAEQFPHMYQLHSSISDFAQGEREGARLNYIKTANNGDYEAADKWDSVMKHWDTICEKALRYKEGLADELSRPRPRLVIDQVLTDETKVRHITLKSLDHWARITYGLHILDREQQNQIENLPAAPKRVRVKGLEQEAAIIETIRELGIDPLHLPSRQPGKSGVKAQVWATLVNKSNLFPSRKAFDKTWEALRNEKSVAG